MPEMEAPSPDLVEEAGPSLERPSRVRYLVLASACALAVITYIHRAGFQANSSELLRDLGMNVSDLSWMTVAFLVAYGLFEVPWGRLGDRYGARSLITLVALGGSSMTAMVAGVALLPRSYPVLLGFLVALRFLLGLFQAGTFPILARLIADWMPTTERGLAQGFIWTCSRAGGMIAPLLMISLYKQFDDWRLPLVIGACLGVVWCLVVWPWLRDRPSLMPRVNKAELALIESGRAAKASASHHDVPWRAMLRSSNVWALCWMYGCLGYSGNFFLYLFGSYLQDSRHLDKGTTKWLLMVPFACGIVACLSGGMLSDAIMKRTGDRRWGRRAVGASGMTLAGLMIFVSPWVDHVGWLAVVYGLTFIGNDLAMGPAWAAASDIGERNAGSLAGAMNMMGSLTAALAAYVAGRFFHAAGLAEAAGDLAGHRFAMTVPFSIFAASYFLGALCWLRVDVTETISRGDPELTPEL